MIPDVMQKVYFENSLLQYAISAGIFVAGSIVLLICRKVLVRRMKTWAAKTKTTFDDFAVRVFQRNVMPLLYFGALYLSVRNLQMPHAVDKGLGTAWVLLATIVGIRFLVSFLNFALMTFWLKEGGDESRRQSFNGLTTLIKVLVWGIGIVLLLDNMGYKVSASRSNRRWVDASR